MKRLRSLVGKKQADDVCAELRKVWDTGHSPERVLFRRGYARHDAPIAGPVSDRQVPPRHQRPPSTRLIFPRGVTQAFYLTMLFVAQCKRRPGQKALVGRPIAEPDPANPDVAPWTDLVMVPAERRPGTTSAHLVEENRVRQLEAAAKKLATNDIRLLDLPHGNELRGPLRDFVPLLEIGRLGHASRTPYTVPLPTEHVFSVPAAFFLNGWHSALTPSEVAMLFTVWASSPHDTASTSPVWLEGETRIRRYGLSPGAYGTQAFLQDLGVLQVTMPEGRRQDGTFIGKKAGESPLLNSFMVLETGFNKQAVPTVMATLKTR